MTRHLLLLTLSITILSPSLSNAQWRVDGAAVCTAGGSQNNYGAIGDGAGGALITWMDSRSGNNDIYVQRLNTSGVAQWTLNGVALCTATNSQAIPVMAPDATTGAIVAWSDLRSGGYDIYARRVSSAGAPLWTADGVAICTAVNYQDTPAIISDGSGGAIIVWSDHRNGTNDDIYAQRINSSGVAQWAANGLPICVSVNYQFKPMIVSDGTGGAVITWEDHRAGNSDIFVQRINSAGTPQWALNGAALCDLPSEAYTPRIVSDGASGAIIVWDDNRNTLTDIFVQRVSAAGVSQWTIQGVPICTAADSQFGQAIVADGAGGAVVTWFDKRTTSEFDIYAQKVNSAGAPQWKYNGAPVCVVPGSDQQFPAIATDGTGGAMVSWSDLRNNSLGTAYAQRLDVAGVPQWTSNGVALSTATNGQGALFMVPDGSGNMIVAWDDFRTGTADVYAQRVDGTYGYWGHPDAILAGVSDIRKDQGGKVAVDWKASGRDIPVPATIGFYSIWRAVTVAPFNQTAGAPVTVTLGRVRADTPPGTLMTSPASSYYWELVGTENAYRWPAYSFAADTRADSVAGNTATTYFMVAAHDRYDQSIAFPSNVLSGHSVDNLAPAAPLSLTAQRIGNYVYLKWNGVHIKDLRDYAIYRKTTTGVTPVPGNFLNSAIDTVLTDSTAPVSSAYYIVTAYDVHANQSAKSNEAAVASATGTGNLPPITELVVLQNHPNPFASNATFDLGLPARSRVQVEVFDVAGRRVADRNVGVKAAGWQAITLDATDDAGKSLASGVYFYRVSANGKSITRKMVIAR